MLVSVCMITYNHASYIAQAIEGVLKQEGSFQIELIIGDDASVDSTHSICEEYALKYPDIVRLLPACPNMGIMRNFVRTLRSCSGNYIAVCEGDDYWIDNEKLSKQVTFLEQNPDFNLCGHEVFLEKNGQLTNEKGGVYPKSVFTFEDIASINLRIPTASLMYRNNIVFPEWINHLYGGDRALIFLNAQKGKLKVMNFPWAVYRIHDGGAEQKYKYDKFLLPLRNIKEDSVYLSQVHSSKHRQQIRKRILHNHLYILYWSIRKVKIALMFKTFFQLLQFQFNFSK